jgi:hypothetical protein
LGHPRSPGAASSSSAACRNFSTDMRTSRPRRSTPWHGEDRPPAL